MGWRSISKTGEIRYEDHENPELGGRPVAQGEEGTLAIIEQHDFGHRVAVDLIHGRIFIDYDGEVKIQNDTLEIGDAKTVLWLCEETNIVAEYKHLRQEFVLARDEAGRKIHDDNGKLVEMRNDILTDLTFRAIWFTRWTNGVPAKVIGLQTTTPELQGAKNIKLLVSIFSDGRIGISG